MKKLGVFVGENNWTFFREIFDELEVHYQTEVYKSRTFNTPVFYGRLNRWAFRKSIKDLLRYCDVCFFEWSSELLMQASWLPKSCAMVARLHSFELYAWAPRINWHAIDKIILVSKSMQERFCELYPEHADKTDVISNGISLDRFKLQTHHNSGLNLGTVCRISPVKRVYELVLMVYELQRQNHNVQLHIAGDPDGDPRYSVAIDDLVNKLEMRDCVHFYGHESDVDAWLQKIDVFISNSYWEGQQVALLEAMATGCYCLAHYWSGADEILPVENLYLTESEFQEKLIDYWQLSSMEKRAKQLELRSIVEERFDIDQKKVQIRQVIDEAITE